jgi:hypothetical protein
MRTYDRADERRRTEARPRKVEERLPIGQAIAGIGGLSVLSWGVVILLAMAVRTMV